MDASDSPGQSIDRLIGQRIRQARQARGISLQALAKAIGVTYQQVQKYETGSNRISASTLYRMIGHLGLGLDEIFDGLENPSNRAASSPSSQDQTDMSLKVATQMARLPAPVQKNLGALIRAIDQKAR